MDDGGEVGKHRERALQERERRERLKIRRVAVEIGVVGRVRHGAIHAVGRSYQRACRVSNGRACRRWRFRPSRMQLKACGARAFAACRRRRRRRDLQTPRLAPQWRGQWGGGGAPPPPGGGGGGGGGGGRGGSPGAATRGYSPPDSGA